MGLPRYVLSVLPPLAIALTVSCSSFYFSAAPGGGGSDLPGRDENYSNPGEGKYQPYTGPVRVLASVEELEAYDYEPLTMLSQTGYADTRGEIIVTLQDLARREGANAIAIAEDRELPDGMLRIRVRAVRILGEKDRNDKIF